MTPTPDRREWMIVLGLTLLGAGLRFQRFGTLGLTHFDEGVYAQAGLWAVTPGGLDPQVIAYAPPGYPLLVGLAYTVLGVSDAPALLVSAACGVLSIPVAAWVGRRTFGAGAGAATAAFGALALAHVAFSRKALTDAPFLLAWLAAIGLGGWFLERPRLVRALALGAAVGAAQNLKYNGGVAGVVVGLAAVFGLIADRENRRPSAVFRTFGLGLVAALVAASAYWPWYRFVEQHGGYADLMRHHRSYLGGPGSWLPHWRQQLAQAVALSGGRPWGMFTWAAAWVGCGLAVSAPGRAEPEGRWRGAWRRIGLLLGAGVLAVVPDLPWWAGLLWAGWLVKDARPAVRVVGAWWLVLSVVTPFYHPYARLWLPLHAAGWVIMAGVLVRLGPFSEAVGNAPGLAAWRRPGVLARTAVVVACLLVARVHWGRSVPVPFSFGAVLQPTDGLRNAVAALVMASPVPTDGSSRLLVYARRPVAFYLALQGKVPFRIVADDRPLVFGPVGPGDWLLLDEAQYPGGVMELPKSFALHRRWAPSRGWRTALDPVTQLDVNPGSVYDFYEMDPVPLTLFRAKPPTGATARPSPPLGPPR